MTEPDIKYLSRKIKRKEKKKKRSSDGENHYVAVSEPKKVKSKDVPKGENLSEAPEDELLDSLPSYFQDRSSVLIEPTKAINLGMDEAPQMVHLAQSLSSQEKEAYTKFLQEKKINFSWNYSDMPGLDTDLIMHHLSIAPGVKPVKKKLRKMHPDIALLV